MSVGSSRGGWLEKLSRRQWFWQGGLLALGGCSSGGGTLASAAQLSPARDRNTYESIGVRPLINARGTITVLGGSRMPPEVKHAMDAASRHYVQIDELMECVGQRLADLTGADWGIVTCGCSAALTVATAACVAGADPDKMAQLPDLSRLKNEVVVPRYSRTAYDHAVKSVGARIVEVRTLEEYEWALGPRTAMVMVLAGRSADQGPLRLETVCSIANARGIPVLVDAAAEELRVPNVHLARGASLVGYSGGKCLRGPQCAGLLLGKEDLVRAAWMHSAPHHGFGRSLKVGREEIMGMLAAVELWMRRNHDAEQRQWHSWLEHISERLAGVDGVSTEIRLPQGLSNRTPRLIVSWDPKRIPLTGHDVSQLLYNGEPRIAVSGAGSFLPFPPNTESNIGITPYQMEEGESEIVAECLRAFFSNPPKKPSLDKPPAVQVAGSWDVTLEFTRGLASHRFSLEQRGSDVVGIHFGEFSDREISGRITGTDVLLRSSYTEQGVRLNFEFIGMAEGESMSGEVSLGEYGRARWSAQRTAGPGAEA